MLSSRYAEHPHSQMASLWVTSHFKRHKISVCARVLPQQPLCYISRNLYTCKTKKNKNKKERRKISARLISHSLTDTSKFESLMNTYLSHRVTVTCQTAERNKNNFKWKMRGKKNLAKGQINTPACSKRIKTITHTKQYPKDACTILCITKKRYRVFTCWFAQRQANTCQLQGCTAFASHNQNQ